jgi:hypothetical protein
MILDRVPQSKRLEAALDGYPSDVIARTERPGIPRLSSQASLPDQ